MAEDEKSTERREKGQNLKISHIRENMIGNMQRLIGLKFGVTLRTFRIDTR